MANAFGKQPLSEAIKDGIKFIPLDPFVMPPEAEFCYRYGARMKAAVASTPGWGISEAIQSTSPVYPQYQLVLYCPHGWQYLESCPTEYGNDSPFKSENLADHQFISTVVKCLKEHIGKPVTYFPNLYSPVSVSDKVEVSYNDIQALVSLDLLKQMQLMPFIPSSASVGTALIAAEIAKAVPAVNTLVTCPVCNLKSRVTISELIIHLNDLHGWSREKIADWLETLDVDLTVQPKKEA
jgi:hypothetical protein